MRLTMISAAFILAAATADGADPETASYLRPLQWEFSANNPVVQPKQFFMPDDALRASCCSVVRIGSTYRMYYWIEDENHHYSVAALECPVDDVNRWKPLEVVLQRQPDKPHNAQGPCYAQVLPREDGPWLMYVCTWGEALPTGELPYQTHLVLSEDGGKTWSYFSDRPILPLTEWWNSEGTGSICVLQDDDRFRAYFTSFSEYLKPPEAHRNEMFHASFMEKVPNVGIGYAESKDGIHWHYPLNHWVVPPRHDGHTPYEYLLSKPWVIKDGDGYRMWCGGKGSAYRIRSLTSADAVHWTFHDPWTFDDVHDDLKDGVGPAGSFDDEMRSYPCVLNDKDRYHMWYTGDWFGEVGPGRLTGIGYAVGTILE